MVRRTGEESRSLDQLYTFSFSLQYKPQIGNENRLKTENGILFGNLYLKITTMMALFNCCLYVLVNFVSNYTPESMINDSLVPIALQVRIGILGTCVCETFPC